MDFCYFFFFSLFGIWKFPLDARETRQTSYDEWPVLNGILKNMEYGEILRITQRYNHNLLKKFNVFIIKTINYNSMMSPSLVTAMRFFYYTTQMYRSRTYSGYLLLTMILVPYFHFLYYACIKWRHQILVCTLNKRHISIVTYKMYKTKIIPIKTDGIVRFPWNHFMVCLQNILQKYQDNYF